jgi:HD-GYP domain-containing protein (c-di-GMP phosphodiesterase class II)
MKSNATLAGSIQRPPRSYIMIDKRFLHLGDSLNFSLYFHDEPTQMSLFLQSYTILNVEKQQKLKEIKQIYVTKSELGMYESFVEENLPNIVQDNSLTIDEKTDMIYASSTELTNSLYNNPNALENAERSEKIVTPILQSIIYSKDTIASYIKIIAYDYYTHTHSLNVSIYSLCLGAALGLDALTLKALGQSALLHDLGKSKIEHTIVTKNGLLSIYEFERVKMHPTLGYDLAKQIGIYDKNILDGILHHHEKLDGGGYPDNLKGDEIKLFPRIIGICDIFDALSTRRSYKEAMTSYDALMLMETQMKTHLDNTLLHTFIKMLHK